MPSTSKTSSSSSKPYERKNKTTTISKVKANSFSGVSAEANFGAPSQHGQSSRKGKKAWRKNVDVRGEEAALEAAREEERVTGGRYGEKSNDQLFTIDVTGDAAVAKTMAKQKKPLRSLAVLHERSAIPSLTSKASSSSSTTRTVLAPSEKSRMRRLVNRPITTLNPKITPAPISTTSEGVPLTTSSGLHDAWSTSQSPSLPHAPGGFGLEAMIKPSVKAPKTLARFRAIRTNEIENGRHLESPNAGTSYNPTAESHAALIEVAVKEEIKRLEKEKKEEEVAERHGNVFAAQKAAANYDDWETVVAGMTVGRGDPAADDDDEDDDNQEKVPERVFKPTKRKTQAERNKALRNKQLLRLEQLERSQRRLLKAISSAPAMLKNAEARARASEEAARLRKLAAAEREKLGWKGGEKVGKFRVEKGEVSVQLGEDLAESLRQVKPEGNLFKDRFLALQKRSLIEPRVRYLPTRKALRTKEYEKHAYKRFE